MSGNLEKYKMSYLDVLEEQKNLGSDLGDGSIGLSDLSAFGSTPNSYANYKESFRSSGNMTYSISPFGSLTASQLQKPSFSYDAELESPMISPERGPRNSLVSDASEFGKSSMQSLDRSPLSSGDYLGTRTSCKEAIYPISRYDLTIPSRLRSESESGEDIIYSMPYKYAATPVTIMTDNTVLSPQLSPMMKADHDLTADYLMDTFAIDNSKEEKDYIACKDDYIAPDKPLARTEVRANLKLGDKIQALRTQQIEMPQMSEEFRNIYENRLKELKDDLKARFEHYKIMLQNADLSGSRGIQEMADMLKSGREDPKPENKEIKKRHHSYDPRPLHEISNTVQDHKKHRCNRHKHRHSHRSSRKSSKRDGETSTSNVSKEVCTSPKAVKNTATSPGPSYKCDRATSPIMWNQSTLTKPALPPRPKVEDFDDRKSTSSITSELKQLDDLPSLSSRLNSDEERNLRPSFLSFTGKNRLGSAISTSFTGDPHSLKKNFSLGRTYELARMTPDSQTNSSFERRSELIVHSCTPPRPVLKSEASTPILYELSRKGSEFAIISDMFAKENKRVAKITKTYTYRLQKDFLGDGHDSSDSFLLNRSFEFSELSLMFYTSTPTNLDIIISSPNGFAALSKLHNANLVFSPSLKAIDSLAKLTIKPASHTLKCVLALISLGNCQKSDTRFFPGIKISSVSDSVHFEKEDIYILKEEFRAIPSYLIEYYEI